MTREDLIAIWSADHMYGPGAQSDHVLLLTPDGTGRYEEVNWTLCGVEYFDWELLSPTKVRLVATGSEHVAADGRITRAAGSLDFPELDCSIGIGDTPRGSG